MLRFFVGFVGVAIALSDCVHAIPAAAEDAEAAEAALGEVPNFYVREVTGYRPNLAICLVCRYGARPVVLICVRDMDEQVERLIEKVDRTVDSNRGVGLRGFGVYVGSDIPNAQPNFAVLARKRKIDMPLALPVEAGGPRSLDLSKEDRVTVLIYQEKKVVRRFAFARGKLTDKRIAEVAAAAEALVRPAAMAVAD